MHLSAVKCEKKSVEMSVHFMPLNVPQFTQERNLLSTTEEGQVYTVYHEWCAWLQKSLEDQIRLSNFCIPSQKRRCLDWPNKSAWQRLGKIKAISKLLFLSISKRAGSSPQHTEMSRISYSVTLGKWSYTMTRLVCVFLCLI